MAAFKVHLLNPLPPEDLQLLQESLQPGIDLTSGTVLPDPPDFQVLVAGRPSRELLAASQHLTTLVIPFAGLPAETRQMLFDFPHLRVYNLHHNAAPTAETAFALLLAAAKQIVPADQALRRHDWSPRYRPLRSILLSGKTALILGFGHIGQRVGQYCAAMGMQVVGIRRSPGKTGVLPYPVEVYGPDRLVDLLPRAQVLIITLPATPDTDGWIGAGEIDRLPEGCLLVNAGRGPVVDQAALYQALVAGKIAAAGLDVWYHYPADEAARTHTPPADYPFHELDQVVMSPHRAAAAQELEALRMQHLASLLNRLMHGDAPAHRVDVAAGY